MKTAIGTKVIRFEPMTQKEFFEKFKHNTGDITPQNIDGYHVQYDNPDGSTYDSWSPKDVFEDAYTCTEDGMPFGYALFFMNQGKKVARKGWNGKGMWICLGKGNPNLHAGAFWNEHTRLFAEQNGGSAEVLPYIIFKTADNKILMGWLASQTDMLSNDWMIVDA